VSIKVICRVDVVGRENVVKLLSLNFKHGKEVVEIRHHQQPVRGAIFDKQILRLKEVLSKSTYPELKKDQVVYYTIKDKEWAEWMSRIFWKLFARSIDGEKRLSQLKLIS